MSTTFSPVETDLGNGAWAFTCSCGNSAPETFPSYADASMRLEMFKAAPYLRPGCNVDCLFYGPTISPVMPEGFLEVNVSMVNAVDVFDALGIEGEARTEGGLMSAEEFEGRVLMALAVAPVSAERPTITEGRLVDCGRPEGYLQGVLERLRAVAQWAREREVDVSWC